MFTKGGSPHMSGDYACAMLGSAGMRHVIDIYVCIYICIYMYTYTHTIDNTHAYIYIYTSDIAVLQFVHVICVYGSQHI